MIGRWCFPLGKVTFQERTVKLQVGRFLFFLNDEIFPHHFFVSFSGLATSKNKSRNSPFLNFALFGLGKSKVLKWFNLGCSKWFGWAWDSWDQNFKKHVPTKIPGATPKLVTSWEMSSILEQKWEILHSQSTGLTMLKVVSHQQA